MSGLYIPTLHSTSSLKKFVQGVQEETRTVAIGWDSAAALCAQEWNALPIDRSRFGRNPGDLVARHLRYMAKLARTIGKTTGLLEEDYHKLIVVPMRARTVHRWDVDK